MASILAVLSLAVALVAGAQSPATDPFYIPPAGFESAAPGTVLRSRTIAAAFLGLIPDPVETYQLLYRTRSINGSAIADVTTVFKPWFPMTDRFVSFQTAYDASNVNCEPSYNYQLGASQSDLIDSAEQLLLQAYLLSGYIVSSPDYEGPEAAWTAGRLAATGVLDSMRAVQNFGSTLGLKTKTPKILAQGYSGGAIATGWAASLQPTYAPELKVVGWSAGGTPANLTATAVFLNGALFSGFLPAAIDGLAKPTAYGASLQPVLDQYATPYGKAALAYCDSTCGIECVLKYPYQSIASAQFNTLGAGLFYEPTVSRVLAYNTMGVFRNETPTAPVYLYHATPDEIIPYAPASALADTWCADGASVDFVTYAAGGHATTEIVGFVGAYKFAQQAFAGTVAKGCSRQTVLGNSLDPLALGLNLEPVLVELINVLHILGTGDSNLKSNLGVLTQSL